LPLSRTNTEILHPQITIEELPLVLLFQTFLNYVFLTNLAASLTLIICNLASRKKLGCGPGVYLLQNVTDYFVSRSSPVYMASLDVSKAFDRINHEKLFVKLSEHGAPQCFISVLLNWYSKLTSCVRWNDILIGVFRVVCGVRQSGILSPFLFKIYVDDLLYLLSTSGHGCHVRTVFYGCIMYADDLILLSPSLCCLQFMVDTCSDYAIKHSLVFNSKKTVFTIVNKPKYAI